MIDLTEYLTNKFPQGGYYIEAGAHDGIGDSITYPLELKGWSGICVEPSSAYYGLTLSRKCLTDNRCLYSKSGLTVQFQEMTGNNIELSGIAKHFGDHWNPYRESHPYNLLIKNTISLDDLLCQYNAPHIIEFFSLDTEGSEYEILNAHNWDLYKILVIMVEHNNVFERRKNISDLLHSNYYTTLNSDDTNDLFIHRSIS